MNLNYMALWLIKQHLFLCFESTKIQSPLLIKLHAHAIAVEATDIKHRRLDYLQGRKELCRNSRECKA